MKKLLALIFTLGFIFSGSSAFAAGGPCECGYAFDLGPGTLTQTINLMTSTLETTTAVATCSGPFGPFYNFAFSGPTNVICNDETFIMPYIVHAGPDGTFLTTDDYAVQQRKIHASGNWGSGYVTDFRDTSTGGSMYQCMYDIDTAEILITSYYAYGNYASTQASVCVPDLTQPPLLPGSQYNTEWDGILTGINTGNPRNGIKVQIMGEAVSESIVWPILTAVTGIEHMIVEYFDNLRGDLDGDGSVGLTDFSIFKADWNAVNSCYCAGYYY